MYQRIFFDLAPARKTDFKNADLLNLTLSKRAKLTITYKTNGSDLVKTSLAQIQNPLPPTPPLPQPPPPSPPQAPSQAPSQSLIQFFFIRAQSEPEIKLNEKTPDKTIQVLNNKKKM